MRIPVLSDLALGQQFPDSKYVAVARVLKGDNTPYPKVTVKVSFYGAPELILMRLITDEHGYVFYPVDNELIGIVFTPEPREGHSFVPTSEVKNSFSKSEGLANQKQVAVFYEVEGSPFSWKPYLIAGGIAVLGYLVWSSYKK